MEDTGWPGDFPDGVLPNDRLHTEVSLTGVDGADKSIGESSVNESSSSQSFVTETNHSDFTDSEIMQPQSSTPAKRPHTKRGRTGKKWVSVNWERIQQLKKGNNGVMPYVKALETTPFPHSQEWSQDNLPDILFYLKPPKSKYEGQPVSFLKENGEPVKVTEHDKPVRDFPILPRRISLEVSGWLVEAWRRIDPRITYADILDRQIEEQGLIKLDKNALQNHCRRECRMVLGMWTSYERRAVPHRTDVEAIENLSLENIKLNTILQVCPERQDRLIKIRLTRRSDDDYGKYYAEPYEVNEANLYETTFPVDHFVIKSELSPHEVHKVDDSMSAAWELSLKLQERARIHGVSHWRKLANHCRPVSWFDRTINKRVENDTFDGGCPLCTWDAGRDQRFHKEWMDEVKTTCNRPVNRKPTGTKGSNSRSSKRRKLTDGRSQNVSLDVTFGSIEECHCCKEVESSDESRSTSEQYPTESPRRVGSVSDFAVSDCVEEAHVETFVDDAEKHDGLNESGERSEIEENREHKREHSVKPATGDGTITKDPELSLTTPLVTTSKSLQTFDNDGFAEACPEPNNSVPEDLEMTSAENDLSGIGSHITMGGGEDPPQHGQDEAAAMSAEEKDAEELWNNPMVNYPLPTNFGAGWEVNAGLKALWEASPDTVPFETEGSATAIDEWKESSGQNTNLPEVLMHHGAILDVEAEPNLLSHLNAQREIPLPRGCTTIGQESTAFLIQPQPQVTGRHLLNQGWGPNNGSDGTPSMPSEVVPDMTSSFRTDSDTSGSELEGLGMFVGNNHAKFTKVDKPASIIGFSAAYDMTTSPGFGNKGKEVSREVDSTYDTEMVFDAASFQERLETSDDLVDNHVSGMALHEGTGVFDEFPTEESYDEGCDFMYDPSAVDGYTWAMY